MKTIMNVLTVLSFVLYFVCIAVLHFRVGSDTVNLVCDAYLVLMFIVYGYYGLKFWFNTLDN